MAQKAGRSGRPKRAQPKSTVRWMQGTPAGLPWGIPRKGVAMEGAMQQAPQAGRQGSGEAEATGGVSSAMKIWKSLNCGGAWPRL